MTRTDLPNAPVNSSRNVGCDSRNRRYLEAAARRWWPGFQTPHDIRLRFIPGFSDRREYFRTDAHWRR